METAHKEQARDGEASSQRPTVARWLLIGAGWICIALAVVGLALPILPTTPFLLLAGACFVRSSPRLHRRMLEDPRFGPYLEAWQRDRSIPAHAKVKAYIVIVATFGVSIWLVNVTALRWMLVAIAAALITFLVRLKTTEE